MFVFIFMPVKIFISSQPSERQTILSKLHNIILEEDVKVTATVEPMMGKEMIVYKCKGIMKYGLASGKNYMSLHAMPIYGSENLHKKYKALLPEANFQKGCINFKSGDEMPLEIVRSLMADCSKIDLQKMREDYLKSKGKAT